MKALNRACVAWFLFFESQAIAGPPDGLTVEDQQFSIGKVVRFSNDIFSVDCYSVLATKGNVLFWIYDLHQLDDKTLVRRCVEYDPNPHITIQSGRYGAIMDGWEELRLATETNGLVFQAVEIPGHGHFSSVSFCETRAAYWVEIDGSWSVRIFDLASKQVLATEVVTGGPIETDNPSYFEHPIWNDSCSDVIVEGRLPIRVKM